MSDHDEIDFDAALERIIRPVRSPKKKRFLKRYFRCRCNITAAATEVARRTVYLWRSKDPRFVEAMDLVKDLFGDLLESIAYDMAASGAERILCKLLEAHRPERYNAAGPTVAVQVNSMLRHDLTEEQKDEKMREMIRKLDLDPETMNPRTIPAQSAQQLLTAPEAVAMSEDEVDFDAALDRIVKSVRSSAKRRFLRRYFRARCNVTAASTEHTARTVYLWRQKDQKFAEAMDATRELFADSLESIAFDLAANGSERLICKLLESHRPGKFAKDVPAIALQVNTMKADISEAEKDEIMRDMIKALELDPQTMNPISTQEQLPPQIQGE